MLEEDDYVVGAGIIPEGNDDNDQYILTITENGFGKRSFTGDYKCQRRGGKGLICHGVSQKTGALAGLKLVRDSEEVMLITDGGIIIRTRVSEIPVYGRSASGVIVMRLGEGQNIVNFSKVAHEEITEQEEQSEAPAEGATAPAQNVEATVESTQAPTDPA
jgi:DNA gyrase subunit A